MITHCFCNALTQKNKQCVNKATLLNIDGNKQYCRKHFKLFNTDTISCCICLDNIHYKNNWKITKCGHHFHKMCWYNMTVQHRITTCPMCRSDLSSQIPHIYHHNIFYVTLVNKNSNDYKFLPFDPFRLFGTNGLIEIKKRHIKQRPHYIYNTFINHFEKYLHPFNTNDELHIINYIASPFLFQFTFGAFSTSFIFLNTIPLFVQYHLTKDISSNDNNPSSLNTMLIRIQTLLRYAF